MNLTVDLIFSDTTNTYFLVSELLYFILTYCPVFGVHYTHNRHHLRLIRNMLLLELNILSPEFPRIHPTAFFVSGFCFILIAIFFVHFYKIDRR